MAGRFKESLHVKVPTGTGDAISRAAEAAGQGNAEWVRSVLRLALAAAGQPVVTGKGAIRPEPDLTGERVIS